MPSLRPLAIFRSDSYNRPTSDTSEAQSRRTSDLVDLTKSTAELVVGANQGISNVERKVDMVVGGLPQIQRGVAQIMSDVPFLQSSFTSMEQRLQAVESLTSQILPGFQTKLDQLPLLIRESLAESTTLARLGPSAETPNSTVVESVVSTTLTDVVLMFNPHMMRQRLRCLRPKMRKSFNLLWLGGPAYYDLSVTEQVVLR